MKSVLALGITLFIGATACSACGFNPKFDPSLDSNEPRGKMVSSQTIQTMPITESIEDSVENKKLLKQIDANDPIVPKKELTKPLEKQLENNLEDTLEN